MPVTKDAHIATWTVTNHKLIAREFGNGEFWLCQQTLGTPGGAEDVFVVREPQMLEGLNLVFQPGFSPADAASFKKHIYPGETTDTTPRTNTGLGKGIPLNFISSAGLTATPPSPTMPAGYVTQDDGRGQAIVVKSQTVSNPGTVGTPRGTTGTTSSTPSGSTGTDSKFVAFLKKYGLGLGIGLVVLIGGILTFSWLKNR